MRIPLVKPNMPFLSEVREYYSLAEKHGQYSNFGLCYDAAITKLAHLYEGQPVLVNNGTTAIQIALQATLPRGSRVALPTFTFTATLSAVVAAGMVPVLFDVDHDNWQIDMELLRSNSELYDAFIVVSPFGYAVDVAKYDLLSSMLGKRVVYDFAPAWGHPISNRNPTTFSFHATKTLPIGEGGVIFFQGGAGAYNGKRLINFDFDQGEPRSMYGMNGKMDELHCATLCVQLDNNEDMLEGPRLAAHVVSGLLSNLPKVVKAPLGNGPNYLQLPVVQIIDRDLGEIMAYLNKEGIACKQYYKPHLHEAFPDLELVVSSNWIRSPQGTLGLPRPSSESEAEFIVGAVVDAVRK